MPFFLQPNYSSIIENCNLWRNFDDIQDSWSSLESIIDYYGNNQDVIVPNAGPGHWNDPDMVSKNMSLIFSIRECIGEWSPIICTTFCNMESEYRYSFMCHLDGAVLIIHIHSS